MVRRFANQVHQQVSRLMRAQYIKQEPAWYQAVLMFPPLPLPPKSPPTRTNYDFKENGPIIEAGKHIKMRKMKPGPLPIQYIEDDVRRQFFRDHPFEAFRPRTLVEGSGIEQVNKVIGEGWVRLRQRGRNPSPEDAIQYTINLHNYHGYSLSDAYVRAVAQFRALRSEHHIATTFAVNEAESLGAIFENTEIQTMFEKEKKALKTWQKKEQEDEGALAARKRWKAIVEKDTNNNEWTRGEQYVRLWKEGVNPDFSPALTQPVTPATEATQKVAETAQVHPTTR